MGSVTCRSCEGRGRKWLDKPGKWVDCRACNGTGTNPNLWSTRCERCRTEIIYKAYGTTPRFCKDCRNIQLEKTCGQMGCNNTIRYSVGWSNVPTYCKRCETKRSQGWSASTCPGTGMFGCGKLIWSPPGKRFNLCPDCSARKKAEDEQKWREKSCPGLKGQGYCGKTIRYRTDWDKVPDICPDCREKAKAEKAKRDANRRTKPCKHCGAEVVYYADGKEFDYCKSCNEQRVRVDRNERGTLQAKAKDGTLLFTFGRCSEPPPHKQGGRSDEKREWARRGYYWVAMPGGEHETFIIASNPVVEGFIQQSRHVSTVYSSAALRDGWYSMAIAVLSSGE